MRITRSLQALGLVVLGILTAAPSDASAFWWRHCGAFGCGGPFHGGPPVFNCCIGPAPPMYFYQPCPIVYGGRWAVPCYPCCYTAPGGQYPPYVRTQQPDLPASPSDTTPANPGTPATSTSMTTAGVLELDVPAEARVFINDLPTKMTGTHRRFVSPGLAPGLTYTYRIRVEVAGPAEPVVETKTVKLHAGEEQLLAFHASAQESNVAAKSDGLPTSLTLHVPAEADVYLGGNPTTTTGAVRVYQTMLPPGQRIEKYTVRVEVKRDGKTLSREQTIDLAAGEARELQFDFTSAQAPALAATN